MRTHQDIDERSLELARAVAEKLDRQPELLASVRLTLHRWPDWQANPVLRWWDAQLADLDWSKLRPLLLEDSEQGRWRRQNNPFCGILSPRERWQVYRDARSV